MERVDNFSNYQKWSKPNSSILRVGEKVGGAMKKKKRETKKKLLSDGTKYMSLSTYARDILSNSLITSWPEITNTKSIIKKIVKTLVFILCLIGFVYQTLDFLWLYLSYPTVVNVLISNPFEIVQPALTFCNRNRRRRSVLCSGKFSDCSFMSNDASYCDAFPRNCPTNRKPFTGVPYVNSLIEDEWYWDEEEEAAHNESMIHGCSKIIEGKPLKCKKPYTRVPAVTSTGEPNMCYTVESLWGMPDEKLDAYPNTFYFELQINTEPEEYIVYTAPVLIQVAVHDRRRQVNPYAEGYSLKGGVQYESSVTMTEKKLLPAPYDTNCTDYLKMWRENNGTGPTNDLMCIENCKLNTLLEQGKCIDKNVAYPNMNEICERGQLTTTSAIIENCTKQCGSPCEDFIYDFHYEEVNNYDHVCKNEWCRKSRIKLSMYFKQFRVTKFQYQPKFESVEMFSYIGGYMGMWLGLSLVSLFDFLETVTYLLYFPIGRLRWKNKRTNIKQFSNSFGRSASLRSEIY